MSESDARPSPSETEALFQAALAHHHAGRLDAARDGYLGLLARVPDHFGSNANLGVVLRRLGRPDEALAAYDRALAARPDDASVHINRANLLRSLKRYDAAIAGYDRALALRPDRPETHGHRAGALQDAGRLDEALAGFERAVQLAPDDAFWRNARATIAFAFGRYDEALGYYDQAIALDPAMALAHRNRGVTLLRLNRPREAIESHTRALALAPDVAEARWYRALGHLLLGDFDQGWRDYAYRWQAPEFVAGSPGVSTPALRARFPHDPTRDDLAGREVLLVGEQGVGDVIMFASLIPDLLAGARRVSLCCDKRLWGLFAASFPALVLIETAEAEARLDAFQTVIGIGSLPAVYRRARGDFPGAPYLTPGPDARRRWAERLGPAADGRRRIGLSWRGGLARTGQAARSIPLAALQPILDLPGCEVVSLQYGAHDDEIAAVNAGRAQPLRTFPKAQIDDFEDLAALVGELDLVISVQTSLVHLTGAVGKPGLVMVPATPEWRYMAAGAEMPWYRSISLFRQGADADWTPVIRQVAAEAATRLHLRA